MPTGIVDTLWFDVDERCRELGTFFDVWQDGLGQLMFGLREDRTFAATVGGVTMSIPRQVAKTFTVGRSLVAVCTMFPGVTVLWTAHRVRTATRTFESLAAYASRKGAKKYRPRIRRANGEQSIVFEATGSEILFGAREQGFGRGFDEVDFEVFDEAQILTESALEDMVPAANQSRFPHRALLFFMGTPPRPKDHGDEFADRRAEALAAKPAEVVVAEQGDALYVECSADPDTGTAGGPSLMDRDQWMKANPSYPLRVPDESMLRMRKNLRSDASWRREALGVWDGAGFRSWQVISRDQWSALAVTADQAPPAGALAYGVQFSDDDRWVACAVALRRSSGQVHVEALGVSPVATGVAPLVEWLAERCRRVRVVVDGKAGAADLTSRLVAAKVPKRNAHVATTAEVYAAASGLLQAVREGTVTHLAQPGLDAAVRVAAKRARRDGAWDWVASKPDTDVTALEAVGLARWAAAGGRGTPARTGSSVIT